MGKMSQTRCRRARSSRGVFKDQHRRLYDQVDHQTPDAGPFPVLFCWSKTPKRSFGSCAVDGHYLSATSIVCSPPLSIPVVTPFCRDICHVCTETHAGSAVPIYSSPGRPSYCLGATKTVELTMRVNQLLSDGDAGTSGSHFSDGIISSATSCPTTCDKIQCSCRTPSVKEAGPGCRINEDRIS